MIFCLHCHAKESLYLLGLDKSVRSDSMNQWFKVHLRRLDSASAVAELDVLDRAAKKQNNKIALATLPYLRGQYYDVKLKQPRKAVLLYREAVALAERYGLEYEWAAFTYHLGIFYYFNDNIPASIECLLRAHDKFKQIGYARDKRAAWHLYHIAYVYYHLQNYRESLSYLQEAGKYLPGDKNDAWLSMQLPNTAGLAYTALGVYDSAFLCFDRTLELAAAAKDTVWQGIALGNKGEVYLKTKQYDKALASLEQNYASLRQPELNGTPGTLVRVLTAMADVHVSLGNAGKALQLLDEAMSTWPRTDKYDYWRQAYLYKTAARAYALKNDFATAYRYQQMSNEISDSLARRDDALRYIYVQQQLASEKHIAQINVLQAEQKIAAQRRNSLLAAIGLFAVIGWMAYSRHRLKAKQNRVLLEKESQLFQSEKLRMQDDLANARELLAQYIHSIHEKSALIEHFKGEYIANEQAIPELQKDEPAKYEYMQQLSDATLLTDEEWKKFKLLFEKVHKGFFIRVKEKLPDLTESEIRLLALIKLNIPNRQIAQMLGISPASVHTARYRLRKKVAVKDEIQIEDILSNI